MTNSNYTPFDNQDNSLISRQQITVMVSALLLLVIPTFIVIWTKTNWYLAVLFLAVTVIMIGGIVLDDPPRKISDDSEDYELDFPGFDYDSPRSAARSTDYEHEDNPGYIYIALRADGVTKIGQTVDVATRMKQHEKDYGKPFFLIKSFQVPDMNFYEKLALSNTKGKEYTEGKRKELREMSAKDIGMFCTLFDDLLEGGSDD